VHGLRRQDGEDQRADLAPADHAAAAAAAAEESERRAVRAASRVPVVASMIAGVVGVGVVLEHVRCPILM
jgi:hypothetical protein